MSPSDTMHWVDLSKKRVWLGLSLPGKKMIRLSITANVRPLFRGQRFLNECYQGPPWKGLLCTAICLHQLAEEGNVSLRATVLADTRNFLKLRYRALGLEDVSPAELLDDLRTNSFPPNVVPSQPDIVINYTVAALDALSGNAQVVTNNDLFSAAVQPLRDLTEGSARLLAKQQLSEEDWKQLTPLWDAALPWR